MEKVKKSPFKLDLFIVERFNIERKPVEQGEVEFNIDPAGVIFRKTNQFHLSLDVQLKDDSGSYDINMTAVGLFSFKEAETDELSSYFYTNAPAIIYPYVRAYISSVTALSGLGAVNLPVLNTSGLRKTLKENTTEA